jgi:hypothetical protein
MPPVSFRPERFPHSQSTEARASPESPA